MDIKARIDSFINTTGVISVLDIDDEAQVRVVIENAESGNIVQVRGKLRGQSSSSLLTEILGNGNVKVNVSTYEQLILECTDLQPDPMGSGAVRIIASSFNLASGSAISIDVPAGSNLSDIETLTFTSSDSSVTIIGDNSSKTIDITAQNSIPYTPENIANKSTNTSLGISDTLYPTQNAVKTYVDSIAVSGAPDADAITKGILKLTGDLGGTADSPTVPGLASKYDVSNPAGYITLAEVPASTVTSVNSQTGAVALTKSDIGLDQVDNTSDADKPISNLTQNALDEKVAKAGDVMSGTLTVSAPPGSTNFGWQGVTSQSTDTNYNSFYTIDGVGVQALDPGISNLETTIYPDYVTLANNDLVAGIATSIVMQSGQISLQVNTGVATVPTTPTLPEHVTTKEYVDALDDRIVPIEDRAEVLTVYAYENNAQVYADGQPGVRDTSALIRDGWYFKNSVAGQKINWYYFDGASQGNVTLGDLKSSYAVMTFDAVSGASSPIIAIYTFPTGTGDVIPGFAHSRIVYDGPMTPIPVVGKQYLVYAGENPPVHPQLPRINLALIPGSSIGDKLPTEQILTISLGSSSGAAVNQIQYMVETLGLFSDPVKHEMDLRIRTVPLNSSSKIDSTYLPSYVDDVLEFANLAAFPPTGDAGIIYVALDTNKIYRWSGSAYIEISSSSGGGGGVTDHTLLSNIGVKTHAEIDTHINTTSGNPHFVTKAEIGLGNVDNTSDLTKPISQSTQSALDEKYDASNPDGYISLAEVPVTSVNGLTGAVVVPTSNLIIQDEGTQITSAAISMNFIGTAVTASSDVSGNVTVSIAGAGDATTLIVEGYNQTGSAIPKMSAVYINGAHGNLPNLVLSQANTEATSSKTLGISRFDISNMSNGFVVADGRLEGLDTNIVGWTEGDSLWLSPSVAGGITNTKPFSPDHAVFLGTLIRKHPTQGVIEVKVQNGFELQELHNVSINGILDAQVIAYENSTSLWKNKTLTKSDIGLSAVDNTTDLNKPISSATATALSQKQDTLQSGTNIKTINGNSILGSGNLTISGGSSSLEIKDEGVSVASSTLSINFTGDSVTATSDGSGNITVDITGGGGVGSVASVNGQTGDVVLGTSWGEISGVLTNQSDIISALNTKQDLLGFTPENIINKSSDTGLGTSDLLYPTQNAVKTYVDTIVNLGTSVTSVNGQTGTIILNKTDIGLTNVDNTSDINKPISSATAAAISSLTTYAQEIRADLDSGVFYFGDPDTDGTWRIKSSGGNLVTENRQSGIWVVKQTITP